MHYNVDRSYTLMLYITNRHPFRYRAVAIMFMIGALLMLLTTVAFMIGGNFEKICQTFLDMSIFRDVIFSVIILPYCNFSLLHFWKWKYLYLRCKQISINNTEKKFVFWWQCFAGKSINLFLRLCFKMLKLLKWLSFDYSLWMMGACQDLTWDRWYWTILLPTSVYTGHFCQFMLT